MTENELRQKVVTTAFTMLGAREGTSEHEAIIDAYNAIKPLPVGYHVSYKDPWCAAFVSVVGAACDLSSIIYPECSCSRMIALYQHVDRWIEDDSYRPSPGDLIMYGWSDSGNGDYQGAPDHVGIVCECKDNAIKVIEGNYKDSVGMRTIAVNARYIRGFCTPDYASMATTPEDTTDWIERLTPEDAYRIILKAQSYAKTLPVPDSVLDEYQSAVHLGLTDGEDPMCLATRWQAALMAMRTGRF